MSGDNKVTGPGLEKLLAAYASAVRANTSWGFPEFTSDPEWSAKLAILEAAEAAALARVREYVEELEAAIRSCVHIGFCQFCQTRRNQKTGELSHADNCLWTRLQHDSDADGSEGK